MITLKSENVIAVINGEKENSSAEQDKCIIVYAKSGKVYKDSSCLTAKTLERRLSSEYYLSF